MSSIIEGYYYDIFISYRQKDNKHDGWVTEFVNNLKGELESTFKEEISVYFDINPHDGLLETHDVNESLKEKLKCLIFIPIISRTYCDPKSFAWEHEFKAFVEMASKDQFGLKVKLPNGNVASRVLPIRIHDLDSSDIKECESLLGSVLRGIEFIYREPGVNKPLLKTDSKYSILINKSANSIKEIIRGLRNETENSRKAEHQSDVKNTQTYEKSIIVLPFENMSSDPEQEYFSDGLTEEIITDLSYIQDLLVISRSSAMTFKGSNKTIPEIAREVNVRYVLEGSVRKSGNNLKIIAQLIDAVTDTHMWAEKYNGTLDDIFEIQEKVAQSISAALKLKITSIERSKITEVPIADINSYQLYLQAKSYAFTFTEAGLDKATRLINQALENSGENALLYASRAIVQWQYHNAGFKPIPDILDVAERDAKRSLELDSNCIAAYEAQGYIAYTKGDLEESVINFRKGHNAESQSMLGYIYALAGQMEFAREASVQAMQSDPLNPMVLAGYAYYEIFRGNLNSADKYLLKACELTPENSMYQYYHSLIRIYSGENENAISTYQLLNQKDSGIFGEMSNMWKFALEKSEPDFQNQIGILREYGLHDKEVSWWIADCSALMGKVEDTLYWLSNSIELGFFNDVFFSKFDPTLAILRDDPRFVALMDKAKEKQRRFKINLEK